MSPLAATPLSVAEIPVPSIILDPRQRNSRDAMDFSELRILPQASLDEGIPTIRGIGVKVDDQLRTPPPHFFLPMTAVGDEDSLPFLPSLNTPPPNRSGMIHLEPRDDNGGWTIRHIPRPPPPVASSPRDVMAESEAAYRHGAFGSDDKKLGYDDMDHEELKRAWPLDEERDPSCTHYIEDASSDASSLSSSPYEFEGNTASIFRMRSKGAVSPRPSEWPPSPGKYDADSQKALQMWIRSAPPLCVSTSGSTSSVSGYENEAMEYDHHHQQHHNVKSSSSRMPDASKASVVGKHSTDRAQRLREAFELLVDVFTPECCAPHMRLGSRPGVLKPWHVLVPPATSTAVRHRQSSSSRLRGCYL